MSKESNGLDMAMRLAMEGNEVRVWQKEPMENFDGIVTKVADYRYHLKWADMIYLDDTGLDKEAYEVQKTGKPAYGLGHVDSHFELFGKRFHASSAQDHLEHDRTMVHSLMEHLQIGNPIEAIQFKDVAEAIAHVKSHPVAHVVKMESSTGDSGKTYVGELPDGSDTIGWLEAFPGMPGANKVDSISLEERKDGVEVACSAWFNGQDFIMPVNINFEHKKLATGNLGFNTGEMGTLMFYDHNEHVPFFKATCEKLGNLLRDLDYRGQIDVNCIVNQDGIWPLELTPRQGYPSSYIECGLQETRLTDLIYACAAKLDLKNRVKSGWGMGVCMVGEGYPFWEEGQKRLGGLPVFGLTRENLQDIHPYDLKFKDNKFQLTGSLMGCATGTGPTVRACQDYVYRELIPQLYFSSMYYRTDIGDRLVNDLARLDAWGWSMPLKE